MFFDQRFTNVQFYLNLSCSLFNLPSYILDTALNPTHFSSSATNVVLYIIWIANVRPGMRQQTFGLLMETRSYAKPVHIVIWLSKITLLYINWATYNHDKTSEHVCSRLLFVSVKKWRMIHVNKTKTMKICKNML